MRLTIVFFALLAISCDKDEPAKNEPPLLKSLGEKSFTIGNNTYPVKIEKAFGGGFVVIGYADNGSYLSPFLISLTDSLKQRGSIFPAFNPQKAQGMGITKLNNSYMLLSTYAGSPITSDIGIYLTKVSTDLKVTWEKTLLSGVISTGPNICSASGDSFVVASTQSLTPDGKFYTLVSKFDGEGIPVWQSDLFPGAISQPETVFKIEDGSYGVIADSITDCLSCPQDRVSVPTVLIFNEDGKVALKKKLDSNNDRGWKTRATTDNNKDIIVAYEPGYQDDNTYQHQMVLLKLNKAGNILWQTYLVKVVSRLVTDIVGFSEMNDLTVDSQNNIYVIGSSGYSLNSRLLIAKFSPDGTLIKKETFLIDKMCQGMSIKFVSENKLIVVGNKLSPYQLSVFYINTDLVML